MITAKIEDRQIRAIQGFLVVNVGTDSRGKKALWGILTSILDGARARWIELAGERLRSTRQAYIQGIQPVVGDPEKLIAHLELLGKLPNLVEQGMSAMDLHEAFLGAGQGRRTASGQARAIPFRHAGPSAGFNAGSPMGAPYQGHADVRDARALGRKIHRAAQKLSATATTPGGKTNWGGALPAGLASPLRPHHTTDIYARMVRQEKTYVARTQSQYVTFRSIAVGGGGEPNPPGTWMHPGIEPANLVDEVAAYIEEIAVPAALAYLGRL